MERISTLLDKIRDLNKPGASAIEIDLMIDYTKVIYADLLEYRNKTVFNENAKIKEQEKAQAVNFDIENFKFASPIPPKAPEEVAPPQPSIPQQPIPAQPIFSPAPPPRFTNYDIRQHIGINDKYLFISELFNDDREAYDEVISEINTFDSEEEAVSWLNQNVYQQYRWKEDTEVLQAFYKSINDFFNYR